MHILTFSETFLVFLVPLVVFLGVKFGFRNPASVKEMTNMRYGLDLKSVVRVGSQLSLN